MMSNIKTFGGFESVNESLDKDMDLQDILNILRDKGLEVIKYDNQTYFLSDDGKNAKSHSRYVVKKYRIPDQTSAEKAKEMANSEDHISDEELLEIIDNIKGRLANLESYNFEVMVLYVDMKSNQNPYAPTTLLPATISKTHDIKKKSEIDINRFCIYFV